MAKCERCGSTDVRWAESKTTGKPYLQDTVNWTGERYAVSRTYGRGPHFKTCESRQRMNAEYMKTLRASTADRIAARYTLTVVIPLSMAGDVDTAIRCMEKVPAWREGFINR